MAESMPDPAPQPTGVRSRITWERTQQARVALLGYVGDQSQGLQWFRISKVSSTYEVRFDPGPYEVIHGPLDSLIEAQEAAEQMLGEFLDELGLTWKGADQ